VRRTPLITFTSKKRCQSASGISRKRLDLKDPDIVDEHIGLRHALRKGLNAGSRSKIRRDAEQISVFDSFANLFRALCTRPRFSRSQ